MRTIRREAIDKVVYGINLCPDYLTQWETIIEGLVLLVRADVDYWYILRSLEVDISDADGATYDLSQEQFDYMWRELQAKLDELITNAA